MFPFSAALYFHSTTFQRQTNAEYRDLILGQADNLVYRTYIHVHIYNLVLFSFSYFITFNIRYFKTFTEELFIQVTLTFTNLASFLYLAIVVWFAEKDTDIFLINISLSLTKTKCGLPEIHSNLFDVGFSSALGWFIFEKAKKLSKVRYI